MKKKVLPVILAAVMGLSCGAMIGCGKKEDENTVRISRWALEWEKELFQEWTAEFTAENPDIIIKWEFTPYTAHFDRLRTDLLSGDAADIIFVNNWGWAPYSKIDVFEDLGQVASLQPVFNGMIGSAKDAFKQGEKVVGLPIGLVSRVPVVLKSDFADAKIDVPYQRESAFTGEELNALLGDVADAKGKEMGINITLTDALCTFLASVDAPLITSEGKIGCNTEAGIRATQEFYDFATAGRVVPLSQAYGGAYGTTDTAVMTGRVVAGYTNPGGLSSLLDAGLDIATIPGVKAKGGKDIVLADYNTLIVPKFSKVKDKAYKVMEWMLSKEQQLKYAAFCDLPVNAEAFNSIMTDTQTWDPMLYQAYGVGIENTYAPPALSTDFQTYLGGLLKNLLDGSITAEQFCSRMVEGEKYL